MAYPGFEPGPPRLEVRRAYHCAIATPFYYKRVIEACLRVMVFETRI
jgi:hypothetical protein